jgi:hypothetical protein
MVFCLFLLLLVVGYVCNRLSRYLIPDSLCSYGWQELLGIIILVCVGFLYIENFTFLSVQSTVRSKKFMDSCSSVSRANFIHGCCLLNSLCVLCLFCLVVYHDIRPKCS